MLDILVESHENNGKCPNCQTIIFDRTTDEVHHGTEFSTTIKKTCSNCGEEISIDVEKKIPRIEAAAGCFGGNSSPGRSW